MGRTSNFKTTRLSFKSKKVIYNPPEKWVVFENTHEAIIDPETWAQVQKIRAQRRRPTKMGEMGSSPGWPSVPTAGPNCTIVEAAPGPVAGVLYLFQLPHP